jgi:hypothetical protein
MLNENFIFLGAAIGFAGAASYILDVLKGKAKPNRVTWFLWALAPLIAFAAQIQEGVGLQAIMTFTVGFNPLLILLASFISRKAEWKLTKFDVVCGLLSLAGLSLWYFTGSGNIAILFGILADGFAGLPTIVKSYNNPETENYWGYLTAAINAGITLLIIKIWDFAHAAFPIYIISICILLTILIKFRLGKLIKSQHR